MTIDTSDAAGAPDVSMIDFAGSDRMDTDMDISFAASDAPDSKRSFVLSDAKDVE